MKILVSAYSCEPAKGSEPGAGYGLARAAAELGECWVLTRENNLAGLREALREDPPTHAVTLVGVDGPAWSLAIKRRLGVVRLYYALWQAVAARHAQALDDEVGGFDIVHHATMSAFWLPVGVARLDRPLVIGPVSGGTFTPRRLISYLGLTGLITDGIRWAAAFVSSWRTRRAWRNVDVVVAQNREMYAFAERRLVSDTTALMQHSHAADPPLDSLGPPPVRVREVLFIGRVVGWKGVLLAVDAFARADLAEARLVFVGDGPQVDAVRRRAEKLGVSDRLEMTGPLPRPEVLERMRAASCLLFPSFHDSAGFVVAEALSLGVPVVCLDHGGPGELVRLWPGTDSRAVTPGSRQQTVGGLAEAVTDFVRHPRPVPDGLVSAASSLEGMIREAYGKAKQGSEA